MTNILHRRGLRALTIALAATSMLAAPAIAGTIEQTSVVPAFNITAVPADASTGLLGEQISLRGDQLQGITGGVAEQKLSALTGSAIDQDTTGVQVEKTATFTADALASMLLKTTGPDANVLLGYTDAADEYVKEAVRNDAKIESWKSAAAHLYEGGRKLHEKVLNDDATSTGASWKQAATVVAPDYVQKTAGIYTDPTFQHRGAVVSSISAGSTLEVTAS